MIIQFENPIVWRRFRVTLRLPDLWSYCFTPTIKRGMGQGKLRQKPPIALCLYGMMRQRVRDCKWVALLCEMPCPIPRVFT